MVTQLSFGRGEGCASQTTQSEGRGETVTECDGRMDFIQGKSPGPRDQWLISKLARCAKNQSFEPTGGSQSTEWTPTDAHEWEGRAKGDT